MPQTCCPTIAELPPPPRGRIGWPWTEAKNCFAQQAITENGWPTISIVSPSYNQALYIETTIRSILLQGYPKLEYFIEDGQSRNETRDIIEKYRPWITNISIEKDRGQTHAINKGFKKSNGEIFNWVNTDDYLLPGALWRVANEWRQNRFDMLIGGANFVDASTGEIVNCWKPEPPRTLGDFIPPGRVRIAQPSTFISRTLIEKLGGFREDLVCVMDYDFYFRAFGLRGNQLRLVTTDEIVSHCGVHAATKSSTISSKFASEWFSIMVGSHLAAFSSNDIMRLRRHINDYLLQSVLHSHEQSDFALFLDHPQLLLKRYFWGRQRRKLRALFVKSIEIS
jgi:glycosyltransferase involved in cell wall biosynthesis